MGNLCFQTPTLEVVECIHQLQAVEKTLAQLIAKYGVQIQEQRRLAKTKLRRRDECLVHMRTIQIIKHHRKQLEQRLTGCMSKRYQLESLNVTHMHILAVQKTSNTFERFLKDHDIARVEALQESLVDMIENACEIHETLTEEVGPLRVDDADIEEAYDELCREIQLPEAPSHELEMAHHELELVPLCPPDSQAIRVPAAD